MSVTSQMSHEMNLLLQFPTESRMNGIKIHHEAPEETVQAAQRLFKKGIIDQPDGGYLTDAGLELIEHLQKLHSALRD